MMAKQKRETSLLGGFLFVVVGFTAAFFSASELTFGCVPEALKLPAEPQQPPPEICPSNDKCLNPCTASPWYVATGTYVTSSVDLRIPTAGFPLMVSRSYDSSRPMDGPIGVGWTSNLMSRLHYATYLFAAPSTYSKEADLTMPDGFRRRFSENPDGTFQSPPGRNDTLVRNPDGSFDLTPERTRERYRFSSTGALESLADEHGNSLALTYDVNGRLERVTDAAGSGRYLEVFYGADGRVSSIRDSTNRQVQYGYDTGGRLTSVTDLAGRTSTYSYVNTGFGGHLLTGMTDHVGRTFSTTSYTPACTAGVHLEDGDTWTYSYNWDNVPTKTSKVDAGERRWIYNHNADGLITDRIAVGAWDTAGGTFHTDYTANAQVEQTIDEVGVKTFYTYDARGNVLTVTRDFQGPSAVRFDYSYDPAFPDNVTSIVPKNPSSGQQDFDWQAWRYDYYQTGSPSPGSLFHVYRGKSDGTELTVSTYEYDVQGQVTRATSATGGVTDYEYDAAGNLFRVTAPANNDAGTRPITTYGYDSLGRVTSVTDPLTHVTTYTYDALDRVLTVTLPKPSPGSPLNFVTTYTYDNWDAPSGLLFTHVTDPNGKVTRQGYDRYGRLLQSIDALNNVTIYTYAGGLLSSIRDANNNVTGYRYDGRRRLQAVDHPFGGTDFYTYYTDGLLQTRSLRTNSMTYTYDRHKRLTKVIYPALPSNKEVVSTYTGQKLAQVEDQTVTPAEIQALTYDTSYRLSGATQGDRGTVTYGYNPDDTVATLAVQSGPTASYAYHPDGSLNTINWTPVAGQFKYRYALNAQYQSITFPNGQTRNYSYDDQGRLLQLNNLDPVAGNLATYAYEYDRNHYTGTDTMLGQRTSLTSTVPSQGLSAALTKYYYDSLYQLTKADYPTGAPWNGEVHSWTYDAIGNRLTNTVNSTTQTYTYQKIGSNPLNWQRLLSDGVNAYSYFPEGSTESKSGPGGTYWFTLDLANRLSGMSGPETASYLYDYQGRRRAKTVGGVTTKYLYDGLNLIGELGASPAEYLFGPGIDEPLAMSRGGQVTYYETDALGSVNALTNSSGTIQNTYLYDAWGQTKTQTGSLANPFTYTSREAGEAGTLFYRARYLSPGAGRFLAEDPLAELSRRYGYAIPITTGYPYAASRPTTLRDPLGLTPCGPPPNRGDFRSCSDYNNAARQWQLCNLHKNISSAHAYGWGAAVVVGGAVALETSPLGGCLAGLGILALDYSLTWVYEKYGQYMIDQDYKRREAQCNAEACRTSPPMGRSCPSL
jgi:RHS repeat-associated protein